VERIDVGAGERTTLLEGATQPSLSADGRRLAFLKVLPSGTVQLWTAEADGAGARPALAGDQEFPYYYSPRISPDGRSIAVSATARLAARPTLAPPPTLLPP